MTTRIGGADTPTIGILTFKTQTVLRKFNDQVVWDSIESQTEVKNRDTIRTEGLSDAVLTLNDGTKINISENSMILLDISDKNINVNFAYGSFETAREGGSTGDVKMNITSGDQTVQVGQGDIKLDKTKEDLKVKVENGEAKITSNGKEETVGKDEVANVNSSGVKIVKPKFGLLEPLDKKNILSETGSESIAFAFSGATADSIRVTSPNIEISQLPDFKKVLVSEKVKSGNLTKTLSSGSYYWRISYTDPETKSKTSTETARFRILENPALRLFLPKSDEIISYTSSSPVVKVAWGSLDLYSNYTAQISKDPTFSNVVTEKQTQNTAIAFDSLADGIYYARVVAKSNIPDVTDKISPANKFTITKRVNAEPPVLMEPAKEKIFPKETIQNNIFFSWKDNGDFQNFIFELSRDSSFKSILQKETLKEGYFKTGKDLDEGTYYWRVRGKLENREDLISLVNQFTIIAKEEISLLSPSNLSVQELNEKGGVLLRWKKLSNKSNYKIEISKNSDMTRPVLTESVSEHFYEFRTKDFGKYFWRIVVENSLGTQMSDPWSFTIESSMETPVLVSPSKNETIDVSNRNSILFSWKQSEKANAYRLKLFDTSGIKEKQVLNERTTQLKYNFTDFTKLNEGKYRVEVCALYTTSEGEKESPYFRSDFFVSLPNLTIPKILTPGTIYVE